MESSTDELTRTEFMERRVAPAQFPEWFIDLQEKAWATFLETPWPTRSDELWRFSSIKHLKAQSYGAPGSFTADVAALIEGRTFAQAAGRLVFANEELVSADYGDSAAAAAGVLFLTIEQALQEHPALLREHFMTQQVRLGSQKFAALHQAQVRAGCVLYVPRDVRVREPFEVFHLVAGENVAAFPHTLIVAEEGSSVTFVDHFLAADPDVAGFACGVNDLIAGPGSQLTYISDQNWSRRCVSVQMNSTVVGSQAAATNLALNFGGRYARSESVSRMVQRGARSDMLSVSVGTKEQEFDQRTLQDHLQPDTTSDLLYKNALFDQARSIFSGLIRVEPGAHRTDAYQKVRNLLLSDEAEANSLPGLEIMADQVRCTHGATSGQVEPEELFYLESRGIPERAAMELIVHGFLNEVVNRLSSEQLVEFLRREIARHL